MDDSPNRTRRRLILAALGVPALAGAGAWLRYRLPRFPPPDTEIALVDGIVYARQSLRSPRPLVIHSLRVDLANPRLSLVTTPGDPKAPRPFVGKRTTTFLRETGCAVAINADYFTPWRSHSPLDFYPHRGDPVSPEGDAVHDGVVLHRRDPKNTLSETLWIARGGAVSVGDAPRETATPWSAVGGHKLDLTRTSTDDPPQPSLGLGLADDEKTLIVVLVDGRQDGYSEGVTIGELTRWLKERGATAAMQLDGGGSATLCARGGSGARILNVPIDQKRPGRERFVTNHLGFRFA